MDECVSIVVEYGVSTEWKNSTLAKAGFREYLHPAYTLYGEELTEDFDSRACVVINCHTYHKDNTII